MMVKFEVRFNDKPIYFNINNILSLHVRDNSDVVIITMTDGSEYGVTGGFDEIAEKINTIASW